MSGREKTVQSESKSVGIQGKKPRRGTSEEFLNREISWLEFNRRVLHEAADERTPLLERLRFLSIFSSNLDEFFMKRVGGLKRQVTLGIRNLSLDGLTAGKQLKAIEKYVIPLQKEQATIYRNQIIPALEKENIFVLKWKDLSESEKEETKNYFRSHVFPVLTPLSVDPGHPFPFISNLSTSLAITLRHPERDEKLFARVKVPKIFPQWVRVSIEGTSYRFVSLIDIIIHHLDDLFPAMKVLSVMPFRITRNADIERDEEDAEDLLEMIEEELKQRRFANCVRLEHGPNPDKWMLNLLKEELDLHSGDIYEVAELLDYTDVKPILDLKLSHLEFEKWSPTVPISLIEDGPMFPIIQQHDILVHHPYESFSHSVERFIQNAAEDSKVLGIKMTLYRTGDNSRIVPLLIKAADMGKQVVVLVELKARFDEERNIQWAQELENSGVHVVYGVVGLKTHSKTLLVVRQEEDSVKAYVHIGTGNYHRGTANLYTDFGLFTCRPEITQEVVELFHYLTGRSLKSDYKKLLVAPINMKDNFLSMIQREIDNVRAGKPAQIVAKFNSLEDSDIIRALYKASQAKVKIQLIVRGFCCLRPGVKGMSENIEVRSIIGRFLEHSRVFYFRNGGQNIIDGEYYIGSADWMFRNLHDRVEVITPILDPILKEKIQDSIDVHLSDTRQSWLMASDGTYEQLKGDDSKGSHIRLMSEILRLNKPSHLDGDQHQ